MVRRASPVPGWIGMGLAASVAAAVVALLPLGSPGALAAHPNHESASQLLSDACRATFTSSAFRARGDVTSGGAELRVDLYFGTAGEVVTVTQHGDQTLSAIVTGSATYVKANGPFWQSETNSSGTASLLEGRWIDMTSDTKDTAGLTKDLNKGTILSKCGRGWSTTYAGEAAVNGSTAIKVHQDSRDGSNPESNTYYVEKGPTPYLLRVSGSQAQKDSGNLVFTNFGIQPDTAAPSDAIPISQFQ